MSDIIVERFEFNPDWTLSKFYIKGIRFGVGVEDELRTVKVHGETAIPAGVYKLTLTDSPKFSKFYFSSNTRPEISKVQTHEYPNPHKLITVNDVPNFSRVLWHWGNTDDDTEGCYIVGTSIGVIKGQRGVVESRKKYEQIYPMIRSIIETNNSKGISTFVEYKNEY
jgi:hypothetical protein